MTSINVKIDVHVAGRVLTAMRCVYDAPPAEGDDGASKLGELVREVARYRSGAPLPAEVNVTIYAAKTHVFGYVRPYKIRDLLDDDMTLRDFVKLVLRSEASDA